METQTIPRIRKDVLTFMPLSCTWSRDLMEKVQKTCLRKKSLNGWIPIKIHIVDNPDLEEIFEDRKAAMRKMGRTEEELKEQLCFMAESWKSVVSMCKYGVRCVEKKTNILGDTRAGIHLNKNYDMLLRFMTFRNFITARCVVVFRVIPGRTKPVMPRFKGRTLLHPSKHYDAHVSMIDPDPTISVCEGLANNFIYIYQLDDETKIPYQHPRQAIPYAVIQLRQPYRMTVGRPFSSFRDRFLAQMRNKESRGSHKNYISRRKDESSSSSSKHERHRHRSGQSDASESDESPTRRKKRSRTPKEVRKRHKTPPRKSSETEMTMANEPKTEAEESCIQSKLQKIEEEIKLRQSKLTKLRHMKISQDSEKINQEKGTEDDHESTNLAVLQSNTVESSEQGLVQMPVTHELSDTFSPKITSVYSTSGIKDFDMSDTFSQEYRELSSGASTPTLDEPGDQTSGHSNSLIDALNNKNNSLETVTQFVQNEHSHQLSDDVHSSYKENNIHKVNDEGHETEKCTSKELGDQHLHSTIKSEVVRTSENETAMVTKETISVTDVQEKQAKQESSNSDQHTHTAKELDIKQLFREAIYQMDPSDLYELLTQKLDDGNNDVENEETITENDKKATEPSAEMECNQGNNEMILDLSCKPKPVIKQEVTDLDNDINEKESGDKNTNNHIEVKVDGPNTESSILSLQSHCDLISVKNESLMILDNLEILASVASGLQPAKSNPTGVYNVNVDSIAVKTNKQERNGLSGKIVSDDTHQNNISSNNESRKQEYIFDAEICSQVVKRTDLHSNDTGHSLGGKAISVATAAPSIHSFKSKTDNNGKRMNTKSLTKPEGKTAVLKSRPVEQDMKSTKLNKQTSKLETNEETDCYSEDFQLKQVLASTKRKTANSVAAAIAATEQPNVLPQNVTSIGSKQVHKRTPKQKNGPTSDDTSVQNSTSCDQLTTLRQKVLRSGKILSAAPLSVTPDTRQISTTADARPASRGNLFEKFLSSDTDGNSKGKRDSDRQMSMAASNLQTIEERKMTDQNMYIKENVTIIKQELNSPETSNESTALIDNSVKDKMQSNEKTPTIAHNVLTSENTVSNFHKENVEKLTSPLQTINDETNKDNQILCSIKRQQANQDVSIANQEIMTNDFSSSLKQPTVNKEICTDSSISSPSTDRDKKEQTANNENVIKTNIVMIKQEPLSTEPPSSLSVVSPIKKTKSIDQEHITHHVLDESIVELMDKQVTEQMNQSEITLKRIPTVIKKEPVSPGNDIILSHNSGKQNGIPEVSTISAADIQSSNVSISSKGEVKDDASVSNTSRLTTSIKKEPVSPIKESFNMSTEEVSSTAKSQKTVTCPQVESSVKETPNKKTEEPSKISTEIDKTLKDLEQVIGMFSQRVRKNSGEVDMNSSVCAGQRTKFIQDKSHENKSKCETVTSSTTKTDNKNSESISENSETLFEKDEPVSTTKPSVKLNEPKQASNIMQIEVITGISAAKKSPIPNKTTQSLTASSKSKTVKQNTANKELINSQTSLKRSANLNKSITKTNSNSDDTIRTKRVLQSAVQECISTGKMNVDVSKRIKKEPVSEDEYHGQSSPVKQLKTKTKQSNKKQIESCKPKLSERRYLLETPQSSGSSERRYLLETPQSSGSLSKSESDKIQKTQTINLKKRSQDKKENPLEAIRTEYSSSKYKDEHEGSHRNDSSSASTRNRNTGKNVDKRRSSSSASSRSSSIESQTRDFTKRDKHLPNNSDRNYSRYNSKSPLKYQSSGSGSFYVKSKWDSYENSTGSYTDRNLNSKYAFDQSQKGTYSTSYNSTYSVPYQYTQEAHNNQHTNTLTYRNMSSIDNRGSTFTPNNLFVTRRQDEHGHRHGFSSFETGRPTETRTYSNNNFSRSPVRRDRSKSSERPYSSRYKRTRSRSNERDDGYDRKRHRSDSRERRRSRLSDRSRERSDSRDRERNDRSRLKRRYSGSRGRDRSSSSELNRRSPSPATKTRLYQDKKADDRFDFYRSHNSTHHNYSSIADGNRGQMLSNLNSQKSNDAEITNTLSKAMSTLLKKIIYDDKAQDNTKEGRMADMVLDMVKARVSGEQNQNQLSLALNSDDHIHSTGIKNTYDTSISSEHRLQRNSTLTSTSRYESEDRPRSKYSNERSSVASSTNRPTFSSTHKTPPIFNSLLIPKYNPNCHYSSFTGTRRRSSSYIRPWSSGRFNSRKSIISHRTYTGSLKEKHSKSESRSTRDNKSPSKK